MHNGTSSTHWNQCSSSWSCFQEDYRKCCCGGTLSHSTFLLPPPPGHLPVAGRRRLPHLPSGSNGSIQDTFPESGAPGHPLPQWRRCVEEAQCVHIQ